MKRTRIKICGLTRIEDVEAAVAAGADALGFVFYPKSPRYVTPEQAARLIAAVPPFVSTVGLFVNADAKTIAETVAVAPVSLLQFHGDETIGHCVDAASGPFLRAMRVAPDTSGFDLLQCEQNYLAAAKAPGMFAGLLLDTLVDGYGGAGKVFDWSIIPKELAPRVVLSGGLNAQNVAEAVRQVRPFALDVSSGVELAKGIKDAAKIRAFIDAVRAVDAQ